MLRSVAPSLEVELCVILNTWIIGVMWLQLGERLRTCTKHDCVGCTAHTIHLLQSGRKTEAERVIVG